MPKRDEDANRGRWTDEAKKGTGVHGTVAEGGIVRDHWRVKPLKAAAPRLFLASKLPPPFPVLVRFGLCADPRSSPLSYSSCSFEKPPLPQPRSDGTPLQSPVAPTLSLLCFSSTSNGVVGLNFASRGSLVAISARNVVTFPSFFHRIFFVKRSLTVTFIPVGYKHDTRSTTIVLNFSCLWLEAI